VDDCQPLADALKGWNIGSLYTSHEPKALQTAEAIGRRLSLPVTIWENLHEHVRTRVTWLGREQFLQSVAGFFAAPTHLVFGEETAEDTLHRFKTAINALLNDSPSECVAVATHGTVITLYMADRFGLDPFSFWQTIQMPDFFVLEDPTHEKPRFVTRYSKP
jgi:broad specificity phosphatase PhoE